MTDTQIRQVEELCVKLGIKRSVLIRDLIRHAYNQAFMPEAF